MWWYRTHRRPAFVICLILLSVGAMLAHARRPDMVHHRSKAIIAKESVYTFPLEMIYQPNVPVMAATHVTGTKSEIETYHPPVSFAKNYPVAWDIAEGIWYSIAPQAAPPEGTGFSLLRVPIKQMQGFEIRTTVDSRPTATRPILDLVLESVRRTAPLIYDRRIRLLADQDELALLKDRRIWYDIRAVDGTTVDLYALLDKDTRDLRKKNIHLEVWRFDGKAWSLRHSIPSPFETPFELIEGGDALFIHGDDGVLWHLEGADLTAGAPASAPATRPAAEQGPQEGQQKEGEKDKPALSLKKVGTLPGASILIIDKDAKRAMAVSDTAIFTIGKEVTQKAWKAPDELPGPEKLSPWAKRALAAWRTSREERP